MTRVLIAAIAFLFCVNLAARHRGPLQGDRPDRHAAQRAQRPHGKITGTLANGALVSITEYADDANGKPWVDVADYKTKKVIGWVFREFVSCF
jgi:hypothetical protein